MLVTISKDRANQVLKSRKLSQSTLADLVGVSRVTINKAINGTAIRYSTLYEIAQALDVFIPYLLGDYPTPERFTEFSTLEGEPIYF